MKTDTGLLLILMASRGRLSGRKKTTLGFAALAMGLLLAGQATCGFAQSPVWTQTSAPNRAWAAMACSADGSKVVAVAGGSWLSIVGPICTSTNSGMTWDVTSAPSTHWNGVTCSSDGTRLAAVVANGAIYTSTNFGVTWTTTAAPLAGWQTIAASADGMKLVAAEGCLMPACDSGTSAVYTSTDGGATWRYSTYIYITFSVASSADGNHLAVASSRVLVSTNAGTTWAWSETPFVGWQAIASSWDGNRLAAVSPTGPIIISTDGGSNWSQTGSPAPGGWQSVYSSADGRRLLAGQVNGSIYTSSDSGATWIYNSTPTGGQWKALASSADGNKLFAAIYAASGGGIYTYQAIPTLTISASNNNCIVSWPASATGYALQQNPRLDPTNWVTLTNDPVSDGIKKEVIIPQTVETMFFRLISL